jgi:hypothetical protein
MVNNNYKTAIRRGGPSAPLKYIEGMYDANAITEGETLKGRIRTRRWRVLDYGCGRGEDADYLGADKYDPFSYPDRPEGIYDVILCTYVLNVVEESVQREILTDILGLLNPVGGIAYFTVRRDIPKEGVDRDGYRQRYVELSPRDRLLPLHLEKNKYEIYYVT